VPDNIQQMTGKIVETAKDVLGDKLRNVILYGSYARGDYNEDSDIDIMVLADMGDTDVYEYEKPLWRAASRLDLENNMMVSVQIKDKNFFNEWVEVLPFYRNVMKDGVALYEN